MKKYIFLLCFLLSCQGNYILTPQKKYPLLLSRPYITTAVIEKGVFDAINKVRIANGLGLLQHDTRLQQISREHSGDMARNNFFSHTNLRGESPAQRGFRNGYTCLRKVSKNIYRKGISENLSQDNIIHSIRTVVRGSEVKKTYYYNSLKAIIQSVVVRWMKSPGHRKNILTPGFDKQGIGIVFSADKKIYVTQTLC